LRLFEGSADLFRQAEDRSGLAAALGGAGFIAMQQGEVAQAMDFLGESLALYRELGDEWGISEALIHLGMVLLDQGDHTRATRYFEEALALAREIGSRHSEYGSLYNLALMARVRGEHERALHLYAEGLKLAAEVGDKADIALCLERLAELATLKGEQARAARLFGASEALLEAIGISLGVQAKDHSLHEPVTEELRVRLEDTSLEALAEGRAMSPEQAIGYALEEPEASRDGAPAARAGLTKRELEVLRLVARGMSNAEIAASLIVSEHTVHRHVANILGKLGVSSRAAAVAQAAQFDLI
jgi:ATP/maltotriose-dependent transcriptional regulator MalT